MAETITSEKTQVEVALFQCIKNSGLEPTTQNLLKNRFLPFLEKAQDWESKAKSLVVTSVDQTKEIKQAHEGRLALKNIRVGVEKTRKELKAEIVAKGKAIDGIANVLKGLIEPTESYLEQQEKFAEIQEAKRIEALKAERIEKLMPYGAAVNSGLIASMSDADFENYLAGTKQNHEAKLEAERKAEAERVARKQEEAQERERQRLENERLKAEAAERDAKLAEERKERELVESELRQKQEQEAKEQREKEEAERQAALAPDKEKLQKLAATFEAIELPEVSSSEAQVVIDNTKILINKTVKFILEQSLKL